MVPLKRLQYRASRRLIRAIIRPRITGLTPERLAGCAFPDGVAGTDIAQAPLIYVLETRSISDLIVLDLACERLGLPGPLQPIEVTDVVEARRFFFLNRASHGLFRRNTMSSYSKRMVALLDRVAAASRPLPGAVVPVGIYWGRAPNRERSLMRLLLSEDWAVTSRVKRMVNLLVSRKDIVVQFGAPLPLDDLVSAPENGLRLLRRAARLLRVRLRNQRVAVMGPDLSHQRTVAALILRSRSVRTIIEEAPDERTRARLERTARRHASEIASNLSYPTIRILERLLRWLWNRIYQGVRFEGVERLRELADTHTLVYVPSHRSHLDYLLLSYLLFQNGLMIPHIAAGDNLNLPVLGKVLRRGGAFFMRRSFRDDALYSAVFSEYLYQVYRRGHSVEFFPEGGRTRTGRLLPARLGLLKTTIEHSHRGMPRPLVLVPVYLGYEKLVEATSYLDELQGAKKRRESLSDLFRSLRLIRQNFGRVDVRIGRPLPLDAWLADRYGSATAVLPDDAAPAVGHEVMLRINAAAAVNPVNLVALVTLSMPKLAIEEQTLLDQIDCYRHLLRLDAGHHDHTLPEQSAREMVNHVESLGMLSRESGPNGDILTHDAFTAVLMTWYRNNVAHVLALPSLLACLVRERRRPARQAALLRMAETVFPYIASELQTGQTAGASARWLGHLTHLGLLVPQEDGSYAPPPTHSEAHFRLRLLARIIMPTLERLFIVIALLHQGGQGTQDRDALQHRSRDVARKMTRLYGLNAPEFFDARLFHAFIDALIENGVVQERDDGTLTWSEVIEDVLKASLNVLEPDFRYAVQQEPAGSSAQPAPR